MTRRYHTQRLTDKAAIRAYLNRDRIVTAYALGDLDDAFWPQSEFYGARRAGESGESGDLVALLLVYRGFDPPVFTAFGEPDGVRAILDAVDLPDEMYYLWLPDNEAALDAYYERPNAKQEWRMVLEPERFDPPDLGRAARINPDQAGELAALYQQAAEPGEEVVAFSPWQIGHGVFYGIWQGGELVAAAGTHVWSPVERIGAIGNVFTRPDARGMGYATVCTAAVVVAGLEAGIDPVILNVRQNNAPAIHVYEKLGFRRCCLFLEGPGIKKSHS
ncbi:MAG: GNAT family N-acetyltransferase [Anaerolineae bacterium]|nr:GNAT family N-acetyltransferase [Anaerolineae bacterium]